MDQSNLFLPRCLLKEEFSCSDFPFSCHVSITLRLDSWLLMNWQQIMRPQLDSYWMNEVEETEAGNASGWYCLGCRQRWDQQSADMSSCSSCSSGSDTGWFYTHKGQLSQQSPREMKAQGAQFRLPLELTNDYVRIFIFFSQRIVYHFLQLSDAFIKDDDIFGIRREQPLWIKALFHLKLRSLAQLLDGPPSAKAWTSCADPSLS